MTNNAPKRAPEPAEDHIALVVRRHPQRRLGFQVEAEVDEGEKSAVIGFAYVLCSGTLFLKRRKD
jgi:hypothetical protein